jgi:hypothetical protein
MLAKDKLKTLNQVSMIKIKNKCMVVIIHQLVIDQAQDDGQAQEEEQAQDEGQGEDQNSGDDQEVSQESLEEAQDRRARKVASTLGKEVIPWRV